MKTLGFSEESFVFLKDLENNNNREWFASNKDAFRSLLEIPFVRVIDALNDRLGDADYPLRGGRQSMYRIHRDVRFSKDKTPYNTHVNGLMSPSGKKSNEAGLLYLQIDVKGGFASTGFHRLSPRQLTPIRDAIIERAGAFDLVLRSLNEAGLAVDRGDALAAMPRGYSRHDGHRHADYIRLRSLLVRRNLSKDQWLSGDVIDDVEALVRSAMPLLVFSQPAS